VSPGDETGRTGALEEVRRQDTGLIQIVDAALADATRRAGRHLACRPGCTQCCYGAFAVSTLDAMRLRNAMAEMAATDPAQAAAISSRAARYLDAFGADFPGNRVTGVLGASEEEQSAFEEFANDAACPALNPESGLCEVYAARPMTCRIFGPPVRMDADTESGLAVCELCFTEATQDEIAVAEMVVPHDEEQRVLGLLEETGSGPGDTIVAYCLTLPLGSERKPIAS